MVTEAMGRIAAFCSYAHEDAKHLAEVKAVLAPLREQAIIDDWSDCEIKAGEGWDEKIKTALEGAHLVLFIVTPDLLNSTYVNEHEIPLSLARRDEGRCEVVPILTVNPKNDELWHANPLAKLQPLPHVGMWIDDYSEPSIAYDAIRLGIGEACKRIGGGDNPYRRSNVGDWRHALRRFVAPTGQTAKWEYTEELIEKTEEKAVIKVVTSQLGKLDEKRIEIDLTTPLNAQAQSFANQTGMNLSGAATMATRAAAGGAEVSEEFVTIGFKSYQTRVESITTQSDLDGLTMETRVRSWRSIDVPFDGAVQGLMEYSWPNGATGQQTMTLLDFGYKNAATEKPTPKIHGDLPPEIAMAMGVPLDAPTTPSPELNSPQIGQSDGSSLLSNAFSWVKDRVAEGMAAQQQISQGIVPGRWGLQANDMQGNMMFDVMLYPTSQLQGVSWNNGVQSQLAGSWAFDPASAVLRIDVNSVTYGYPPSQYWVTFQIQGSDPTGYHALDMNGRPFRIWMM